MSFKKFYLTEDRLRVETDMFDKQSFEKAMRCLNKKGYDLRNAEEVRRLYDRMNTRGGVSPDMFPDHYQCAVKFLAPRQKRTKTDDQKIVQRVARHFGLTGDFREAGYILPSGALLDMSGKKEGGTAGMRSYDHRNIGMGLEDVEHPASYGGSDGMMAFMEIGPIRIDFMSGSIHIFKEPNAKQYRTMKNFIMMSPADGISLDIEGKPSRYFENYERRKVIGYIKRAFGN
jgi:hypothetical protein